MLFSVRPCNQANWFAFVVVLSLVTAWVTAWAIIDTPPTDGMASVTPSASPQERAALAGPQPQDSSWRDTVCVENPACLWVLGCCGIDGWFWDYDSIDGPLHGNPPFRLFNSALYPPRGARFYGPVTSASTTFYCTGFDEGGGCPDGYATFYEGYELGIPEVNCEVSYDEAEFYAQAMNGGLMLRPSETWIEMIPDGTVAIYQPYDPVYGVNPPPSDPPGLIIPIPPSSVIALDGHGVNGYMHVQGTLFGRLTLTSGSKMYVDGDITLVHDPRMGPSNDCLGLLAGWKQAADGYLIVPDIVPFGPDGDRLIFANYIGPHCNASIYVLDYQQRDREGILEIYGSVFQGQLRPTENSEGTTGYGLNLIFDHRTCESPPPAFPTLEWGE